MYHIHQPPHIEQILSISGYFFRNRSNICFFKVDFILVVIWVFEIMKKLFSSKDISKDNKDNCKTEEYFPILMKTFLDSVYFFKA